MSLYDDNAGLPGNMDQQARPGNKTAWADIESKYFVRETEISRKKVRVAGCRWCSGRRMPTSREERVMGYAIVKTRNRITQP